MTKLPLAVLQDLQTQAPDVAWSTLASFARGICDEDIATQDIASQITKREQDIATADHFLATAGWDLWESYYTAVKRTAPELLQWWASTHPGRAVLILDSLSLRESPFLIAGALERGYKVTRVTITGSELPADTTSFAQALGFSQRSALENDSAGTSHKFSDAHTESTDIPWHECAELVTADPDWLLWHHWPDVALHRLSSAGKGIVALAREVKKQLTSDDFWKLIRRLTTGRRLVITGDHGYAATGQFPDTGQSSASAHLKSKFGGKRFTPSSSHVANMVPPLDIDLVTPHGTHSFVLGRRKWRVSGGYPTLAHGGLSILEVFVPMIELSRGTQA